ncbi:hypothetical protein N7492_000381 [Penicillium capsulatum]|uniref:WSC domain-containing protein n=1 Tax=Penicillium capsulatum TaxID=69766 RepID=A0A9W9IQB0_9EURO|nr:hypothetical protein N7492_000381 [Penicillium capsulatum]KAJ6130555.1 hypothetical protein N7512_003335 [Penicillium capsulatum]
MRLAFLVSAVALLAPSSVVADLAYCATDNTGSDYKAVSNNFQSNGLCTDNCGKYAYGVLQGKKCWCTNVVPSKKSQKSIGDCDTKCPGYPTDHCGSAADGVFAYVEAAGNPTSTAGDSGSTSRDQVTTSTSSSTSQVPTVSHRPPPPAGSLTTETNSSLQTSDSTATTPSVAVETNSGGEVKTITVGSSSATAGADGASLSSAHKDDSKLSGGSIAGIVIGVIGGLALVGALIFLVFFYRKRAARATSPTPSQDMTDRNSQGSNFSRGVFPQGQDTAGSYGRNTAFTDNRMKNTTLYPNGPRDSSVSLQDNEDYSRPVLRVTNN